MSASKTKNLHVLVATPLGREGKGGIDRIMDAVRGKLGTTGTMGTKPIHVRFAATRGSGSILFSPVFLATFLLRMVFLRLIGKCDVVHINLSSHGSTIRKLIVGKVARLLRIPYVQHIHGSRFREFYHSSPLLAQARIRSLLNSAARVIVLGTAWREFVLEERLASPERIVVLPNAVPIPRRDWRPAPDGKVTILFLGQLGNRKGTPQLVEALGRLRHFDGWRAVLAGDGELVRWRKAIADLELSDRVEVPGWVGPQETESLLAGSDILVLPSFAENLPMSVIEGMAAGLAILTTPVGATPDIIKDGENGLLVAAGDVDALTAAIERLVGDAALRRELGRAAQNFHREHLEIDAYVRRLCSVWRESSPDQA